MHLNNSREKTPWKLDFNYRLKYKLLKAYLASSQSPWFHTNTKEGTSQSPKRINTSPGSPLWRWETTWFRLWLNFREDRSLVLELVLQLANTQHFTALPLCVSSARGRHTLWLPPCVSIRPVRWLFCEMSQCFYMRPFLCLSVALPYNCMLEVEILETTRSSSLGSHSAFWPLSSSSPALVLHCLTVSAFSLPPIFPLVLWVCHLDSPFLPYSVMDCAVGIVEAPLRSSRSYYLSYMNWLIPAHSMPGWYSQRLCQPFFSLLSLLYFIISLFSLVPFLLSVQVTPTDHSFQTSLCSGSGTAQAAVG